MRGGGLKKGGIVGLNTQQEVKQQSKKNKNKTEIQQTAQENPTNPPLLALSSFISDSLLQIPDLPHSYIPKNDKVLVFKFFFSFFFPFFFSSVQYWNG